MAALLSITELFGRVYLHIGHGNEVFGSIGCMLLLRVMVWSPIDKLYRPGFLLSTMYGMFKA